MEQQRVVRERSRTPNTARLERESPSRNQRENSLEFEFQNNQTQRSKTVKFNAPPEEEFEDEVQEEAYENPVEAYRKLTKQKEQQQDY